MAIRNILCIGAGYVGGPTMSVIADRCPDLRVVVGDIDADRIREWNSDDLPVYEPGLDAIVKRTRGRNLFFEVISPATISGADLIFVSVNTPTKTYGAGAGMAADLRYWDRCARDILAHAKSGAIVVEKSTVPVRTAEAISRILHSSGDGRTFHVLSNPEFLAEGTAIRDLEQPDRVLIGGDESAGGLAAAKALQSIYARWVPEEKILLTNVWSSELSKLVANAMLAQRVSSINAVTALCERTKASVADISRAVGMDPRIGSRFLEAGVGFGGSCFGKDILNLAYICESFGLHAEAGYWKQVVVMNDHQIDRFAATVVEEQFRTVAGKRLAVFGFAFKPNTNDTRDSPAIRVCKRLLEEQAQLAITDPRALDHARRDLEGLKGAISYERDPYKAAEGAHAIVLVTHWPQFRELDYRRIYASMAKPAFVFDGRAWLDAQHLAGIGFNVFPIGDPPHVRA